jgi:hypothetical protein
MSPVVMSHVPTVDFYNVEPWNVDCCIRSLDIGTVDIRTGDIGTVDIRSSDILPLYRSINQCCIEPALIFIGLLNHFNWLLVFGIIARQVPMYRVGKHLCTYVHRWNIFILFLPLRRPQLKLKI